MRKHLKNVLILLLAFCMCMNLTACDGNDEETVLTLVKGNIAEIYLGRYDSAFLKSVNISKEEAEKAYLDGIQMEAEYFASYWGIIDTSYGESYDDLDPDLKSSIVSLYKEIYSHSKYEVISAAKQDAESYAVKVKVNPINIMELASTLYLNDQYEPLNAFWEKYAKTDFSVMTDEEYMNYTNEYGEIIVQLVKDQLPNLDYMDEKSQNLQVDKVNDVWKINEDDWSIFDSYVIYYP